MTETLYNGIKKNELEKYFLDSEKVFSYGKIISPKMLVGEPYNRVGAHVIFVPLDTFKEAVKYGVHSIEIKTQYDLIISTQKLIQGKIYVKLIDNKTDQTREVLDYIVSKECKSKIYVISPDNMFWFFHDMGHGYLSEMCNNFYENVYGFPEMLVNIFACLKQKQYKVFSRKVVNREIGERCKRYTAEDKEYFFNILDSLGLKDDL